MYRPRNIGINIPTISSWRYLSAPLSIRWWTIPGGEEQPAFKRLTILSNRGTITKKDINQKTFTKKPKCI